MTGRPIVSAPVTAGHRPSERGLERSPAAGRIAVVALTAFSAWLRRDRLGARGLYLDDAWVAVATRVSGLSDLLRIGSTSPGFVFFLVRPWARLFGSSTTALQLLPFVLGVIASPLCFFIARRWKVRFGPALLGGVLLAVSPVHRTYSTNLKQYTAEAIATMLLLWSGSLVIAEPGNRKRWGSFLICSMAATVLSMSEAIIVLALLAGATIAAARHKRTKLPRFAIAAIEGYALFAIAWYAIALKPHLNPVLYTFWNGKFIHIDRGFATVPGQVVARFDRFLAGFSDLPPPVTLVLIGAPALVMLVRRPAFGVALLAPIPLALVLAMGHVAPVGAGRTDIYLYPALALVVATGLDEIIRLSPRLAGPVGLASLLAACLMLVVARPGLPAYPVEDVKPLVRRLEREREAGDLTIIYPMASFGYGLYTRSAVHLEVDNRYPMSFFVAPEEPRTTVLPMERKTPERYAYSIGAITSETSRVWLLGAHIWPDWHVIRTMLVTEGFRVKRYHTTKGAILILYERP